MEPGSFLTAFLFSVVPAIVLLTAVYWLDRYEKEPARFLLASLVLGAVVAPFVAVQIQSLLDAPSSMVSQATVPFSRLTVETPLIEEIVRGLAILAVFLLFRREFDNLLDGLVYGGIVGIGFGLAANFWSILNTPSLGDGATASFFSSMVSSTNHVFYGGVIGMALAAARRSRPGGVLGALLAGIAGALGFHLLHDYLPSWVATSDTATEPSGLAAFLADVPNLLGLIALGAIVAWTSGREASVVGRELQPEVESGVVSAEDYAVVTRPGRRFGSLMSALFSGGLGKWRARRRLYVLEVELAFRKHHDRSERPPTGVLDQETYRRRILDARAAVQAGETA